MNGRLSLARGWTEPGLQTLWLFLIGGLLVSKDYSRYVGKLWHDQDDLMTGAFPAGGAMAPRGRRRRCGYATGTVAIRPEPVLHPHLPIARDVGISLPTQTLKPTKTGLIFK